MRDDVRNGSAAAPGFASLRGLGSAAAMSKNIAVICALPPERNVGMATVDLAASAVLPELLPQHARSLDARVQWLEVIEAVKQRDAGRFVRPFLRSSHVSQYLVRRLAEQVWVRAGERLKRSGS